MATAQEMLDFYLDAEASVLQGQTVRHGERLLTMADLEQIRAGRREWQLKVNAELGPRRSPFAQANFGGVK